MLSVGSDRPATAWVRVGQDLVWEQSIDFTGLESLRHVLVLRGSLRMPLLSLPGPFALADGQDVVIEVDEVPRTVTFSAGDFDDIANATASELALQLAPQLAPDVDVRVEQGERVSVRTRSLTGKESILRVTGGTAAATLGLRDLAWVYELRIGGTEYARRVMRPGDSRYLVDVGAVLAGVAQPATYQLALRIEDLDTVGDDGALVTLELPGVYVDALMAQDETDPFLLNRDPEPNETGVRVGRVRYVDCCSGVGPVDTASIEVTVVVAGVSETAYTGGSFVSPWDGSDSSVTSVTTRQVRVALDRTSDLPGDTLVEIQVSFDTTGFTPQPFDGSYSWTTEDLTPPVIAQISAPHVRFWQVRFNEAVTAETCVPSNFSVELVDTPAYRPDVIACVQLAPDLVELELDQPASFGRTYEVVVASAEDANNNESGELRAQVVALRPECMQLERMSWFDLVAPIHFQISTSGTLRDLTAVLDELLEILIWRICDMQRLTSVDEMPDVLLDNALALMGGSPLDIPLTSGQKRLLLSGVLWDLYRRKGTRRGIEDAIRVFVGVEAEVFRPYKDAFTLDESVLDGPDLLGGDDVSLPLQFGVRVLVDLTTAQEQQVERLALLMKREVEIFIGIEEPEPPATPLFTLEQSFLDGVDVLA